MAGRRSQPDEGLEWLNTLPEQGPLEDALDVYFSLFALAFRIGASLSAKDGFDVLEIQLDA